MVSNDFLCLSSSPCGTCHFVALHFSLTDLRFVKRICFVAYSMQQRIDSPQSPTEHPSVLQWAAVAEMSHLLLCWIKPPFIIYPKLIWKSQRNGRSLSAKTLFYIFFFFFQGIALSTKANISATFNLATKPLAFLFLHYQQNAFVSS